MLLFEVQNSESDSLGLKHNPKNILAKRLVEKGFSVSILF